MITADNMISNHKRLMKELYFPGSGESICFKGSGNVYSSDTHNEAGDCYCQVTHEIGRNIRGKVSTNSSGIVKFART